MLSAPGRQPLGYLTDCRSMEQLVGLPIWLPETGAAFSASLLPRTVRAFIEAYSRLGELSALPNMAPFSWDIMIRTDIRFRSWLLRPRILQPAVIGALAIMLTSRCVLSAAYVDTDSE